MEDARDRSRAWQAEADLLADGREILERLCNTTRYRHLYPKGPNLALLLAAYQELDRLRAVGRLRSHSRRRNLRVLRKLLKTRVRRDALDRNRRLHWHYPPARPTPLDAPMPGLVERSLSRVDPDARDGIHEYVHCRLAPASPADESIAAQSRIGARLDRGVRQFREALINEALANPAQIPGLHPQYLLCASAPLPTKKQHPIATLLLLKLPLYFWMAMIALFNTGYLGAYLFFNDARLGQFVSDNVSGVLDGDLIMEEIHWRPRLIFDLLTGTPSPMRVRQVTVWEPHKRQNLPRERQAVHAEEVNVTLVLHEIIPWNLLGIPKVFEIPWVLHFGEANSETLSGFTVREYETQGENGALVMNGLRDAFKLVKEPDADERGLSVAVDDGQFAGTDFLLDSTELGDWWMQLALDRVTFSLRYDSPDPRQPAPDHSPFTFHLAGHAPQGALHIDDVEISLADFTMDRFHGGRDGAPLGDVHFEIHGTADGSPVHGQGALRDALPGPDREGHTTVVFDLMSPKPGALVGSVSEQLGLEAGTIDAYGGAATARVDGPLSSPTYHLAGQRMTVDALGEPAWAMDDVSLSVSMVTERLPAIWEGRLDADAKRSVVYVDTFRGTALDGSFALRQGADRAHIVLPANDSNNPYLLSADLDLTGINAAQLSPDDPGTARRLQGAAGGRVNLRRFVFKPGDGESADDDDDLVRLAEVEFDRFRLLRDRGPRDDGLPRTIAVDGGITVQQDGALDMEGLQVATEGGRVKATGGIDAGLDVLDPTTVSVDIDDGPAFLRAFGLEPYFDRLRASMEVRGPVLAPSGSGGVLTVSGLGLGPSQVTSARMWLDRETLHLQSPNTTLFGGHGSLELDVVLFEGRRLLEDPLVRGTVKLRGVSLERVVGKGLAGDAEVDIALDDGDGRPAPLSAVRVRAGVYAAELTLGGTTYRDATASCEITREKLRIDRLLLPYHRPVSPFHADGITVPVGEITGVGTVGFEEDPNLDLELEARGIPLGVVARLLEVDVPLNGQIASGTRLEVRGTLNRPHVQGAVMLAGLGTAGIHLGDGQLQVTSADVPDQAPLRGHRELRVQGEMGSDPTGDRGAAMQWILDAVVAVGAKPDRGPPQVAAELDVRFDRIALRDLLANPVGEQTEIPVEGALEGLSAHVLSCNPGDPMLSACLGEEPPGVDSSLSVQLQLEHAWFRGRDAAATGDDPCDDPHAMCTAGPLVAAIDWPLLRLSQPWDLRTGGDDPARLRVSGQVDLSPPPASASPDPHLDCPAGAAPEEEASGGLGSVQVTGTIDFEALQPLMASSGVVRARGRMDVQLAVSGHVQSPRVAGSMVLPPGSPTVILGLGDEPVTVEFPALDLRLASGGVTGRGTLRMLGEVLDFGEMDGVPTSYTLQGPCSGAFSVGARGTLSSKIALELIGEPLVGASGAVDLPRLAIQGRLEPALRLDRLDGTLSLGHDALRLEFSEGVSIVEGIDGRVDFERCTLTHPCEDRSDGAVAVFVGGRDAGGAASRPGTALRVKVGSRGRAAAWGHAYVSPDLERVDDAHLRVQLSEVPYRSHDPRGRPQLETVISSDGLLIHGGDPLIVRGPIRVERSRWIRDAQGVEILSLMAPDADMAEAPPPEIVRGVQLDLDVRTTSPLRVENNIASGVEANVVLGVGGTYENPEFTGRIVLEPGGTVDPPYLSGTFEIQRGRVNIEESIETAGVDVLALRNEPVYIEGQPRQVMLLLGGTLSGLTLRCATEGEATSALDTTRGCVEYMVLGAGDVEDSQMEVQRTGGGGLLYHARKPFQIVSNVAQFDVGSRIEEQVPRWSGYIPDVNLRLAQVGPEVQIATPRAWADFDYGHAVLAYDYTRGYPGSLLRENRELTLRVDILDPITLEFRKGNRSYLNERIIFDPLEQRTLELRFDFQIPSLR